jgi:hypothetical protein
MPRSLILPALNLGSVRHMRPEQLAASAVVLRFMQQIGRPTVRPEGFGGDEPRLRIWPLGCRGALHKLCSSTARSFA